MARPPAGPFCHRHTVGTSLGRATAVERAFDAWLNLLRQRSPRAHVQDQISVRNILTDSRSLSIDQIDLLTPDDVSQEDESSGIVVAPVTDGRYAVVAGYAEFAAAVAMGLRSVGCRILESGESEERESGWIDNVCFASTELCIELETEAFSEQRGPSDSSQVPTSPAMHAGGGAAIQSPGRAVRRGLPMPGNTSVSNSSRTITHPRSVSAIFAVDCHDGNAYRAARQRVFDVGS
jgi:hypothetical protein